jgi:DNA-binding NarL/FixJ family response regulator
MYTPAPSEAAPRCQQAGHLLFASRVRDGAAANPAWASHTEVEAAGATAGDGCGLITVVLGCFSSLLSIGLTSVLRTDPAVRILDTDVANAQLEEVVARQRPCIAMLGEQSFTDLTLLARLRSALPTIALVVLAYRPTRAFCLQTLGLGASACLCNEAPAREIVSAVRVVAGGRHMLAWLDSGPSRASDWGDVPPLTQRESEVLRLVGLGQTDKQIALALHIEPETARSHVKHICRKLGVGKRRELTGS